MGASASKVGPAATEIPPLPPISSAPESPVVPSTPLVPELHTTSSRIPSILFATVGPAFFSPSVATSTIDLWTAHGGTILPIPSALVKAHTSNYLYIGPASLRELQSLLESAAKVFVIPDDPLIHFLKGDIVILGSTWVGDCAKAGAVLPDQGYEIVGNSGAQAEKVRMTLDRLAARLQAAAPRSDRTSAFTPGGTRKDPSPPLSASPDPTSLGGSKRTSKSGKKVRYILQPYLELDLSSPTLIATSSPPHSRSSSRGSPYAPAQPTTPRPDAHKTPQRRLHIPNPVRTPFTPQRPPPALRLATPFSSPSPPPPDCIDTSDSEFIPSAADLKLPSYSFMLDTDLSPGFPLEQLDEAQMAQLLREIVEDASRGMEGEKRYWDAELGWEVPFTASKQERRMVETEEEEEEAEEVEEVKTARTEGAGSWRTLARREIKAERSRLEVWLGDEMSRSGSRTDGIDPGTRAHSYDPRTPQPKPKPKTKSGARSSTKPAVLLTPVSLPTIAHRSVVAATGPPTRKQPMRRIRSKILPGPICETTGKGKGKGQEGKQLLAGIAVDHRAAKRFRV
ncbi:uncharacterized protein MKK02DRAFT_41696 [Dioszegia hungarica]|uniref:BRCT domain-containing protein n=1 Tax=Dioszegia hungarica TaxID=4972 RepID=A0AA38LPH6_9TREE|nr:uncharacterized protein MKK02DRAFT_41696 [Dioszegia hungarica]KAI9632052.1 hypothetical protein MKK02DRAFT_41696 [Dioszegia hungarica]